MSDEYDYIFLDLPPIAPLVDVKAMVDLVDGLVLVIEWGKTRRAFVRANLETEAQIRNKCVGTILNKVNLKRLPMYDETGSGTEYSYSYNRYYRS
jgi:succinoglycan biosynthesis transport protein ExoP